MSGRKSSKMKRASSIQVPEDACRIPRSWGLQNPDGTAHAITERACDSGPEKRSVVVRVGWLSRAELSEMVIHVKVC